MPVNKVGTMAFEGAVRYRVLEAGIHKANSLAAVLEVMP